jgi:signal-transduction protein with cAMP-binding, CBS, and nucleotidyltransferase domain
MREDQAGRGTGAGLWASTQQRRGVAVTSTGENTETDVAYIGEGETLQQAGHRMNQLGVAALPVCGEDGKFQGIITRGVVVEAIAAGGGPQTVTVGEVASRCWSLRPRSVSSCQYSTPGRGAADASCRSPAIT